jgi:hypothetical protein
LGDKNACSCGGETAEKAQRLLIASLDITLADTGMAETAGVNRLNSRPRVAATDRAKQR